MIAVQGFGAEIGIIRVAQLPGYLDSLIIE